MDEIGRIRAGIDAILEAAGVDVDASALEAYMRDGLRGDDAGPEQALNRALLWRDRDLRGTEQEKTLRGLAAKLFEWVRNDYDPAQDVVAGSLRAQAIEAAYQDVYWLANISGLGLSSREMPEKELEAFAEESAWISSLFKALNVARDSDLSDRVREALLAGLVANREEIRKIKVRAQKKVDKVLSKHRRALYRSRGRRVKPTSMIILEVSLTSIRPPIWRRIVVPDCWTLLQLHGAIQEAMGWKDYHLHTFTIAEVEYSDPTSDEDGDMGYLDEQQYRLSAVLPPTGRTFHYVYDFGDSWRHSIKVVKRVLLGADPPPGAFEPMCVGGERACPPEDCGGVGGYQSLVQALRCPEPKRTEEMQETVAWAGEWDPEAFDVFTANRRLKELLA